MYGERDRFLHYGKTGEKHFGVKLTPLEEQIDLEV